MESPDELIAILLPFAFSAMVIVLGGSIELFAEKTLKLHALGDMSESVRSLAVKVAAQVYIQLGFLISVLYSSIVCVAYTARSSRPILAALASALLIGLILVWFLRWQYLDLEKLKGSDGRGMRWAKWLNLALTCAITLYAWYSPIQKIHVEVNPRVNQTVNPSNN
jgi:hypothetical protein